MKQTIVLDTGVGMSTGKLIAQACHASVGAYEKSSEEVKEEWRAEGAKKIALKAGEKTLEELHSEAEDQDVPAFLVEDAGMTELDPGTVTALGVGPSEENRIDQVTGDLEPV